MVPSTPIIYVDTPQSLGQAVAHLSASARFAFDLEFDSSRYSYGFTLCLIQVCTAETCFIIDPLVGLDLAPLYDLFRDANKQKVAHCSDQDLRLLHLLGCRPQNVEDTETMAKLLNYERFGLTTLLKEYFDFEMDKKMQVSNWNLRPLLQEQIDYAALDVLFLLPLYDKLLPLVREKGIEDWIDDERRARDTIEYEQTADGDFLTKADKKILSPFEQYVLNALLKLRDRLAKGFNKPPHQIIDNELMRELVLGKEEFVDWLNLRRMYRALHTREYQQMFIDAYEEAVEEATEQGLSRQTRQRLSNEAWREQQRLQDWREEHRLQTFRPIRQALAEECGEFALRFIFSESTVTSILMGQLRIGDIRTPYSKNLVLQAAEKLNIDLSPFM